MPQQDATKLQRVPIPELTGRDIRARVGNVAGLLQVGLARGVGCLVLALVSLKEAGEIVAVRALSFGPTCIEAAEVGRGTLAMLYGNKLRFFPCVRAFRRLGRLCCSR